MKDRIYVCHTYYHVYVACLKELNLEREKRGNATLVMSTMSNDFGQSFLKPADPYPLYEASGKGAGALRAGGL